LPASDLAPIAAILLSAVRDAGVVALKTFKGDTLKHWTKAGDSPVSEADMAVDALLKERLAMPGIGWLSEETEDNAARLEARRVWIADPIDGTRSYIAGFPDWTIAVGLVENGRPILGCVFAPVTDEMFFAEIGKGATCNGVKISVVDSESLDGARLNGPRRLMEDLQKMQPKAEVLPRVHSLALRFSRVAQGHIDVACSTPNSKDWDLAAADLLVHEAGGLLTSPAGEPILYNRVDSSHGPLVAAGRLRSPAVWKLLAERHT
jgi:myo-inositol-1(or 4)-monophosphatase